MSQSSYTHSAEHEGVVEPLSAYRKGGYHPLMIGDSLNRGRYHVLHKLGYGAFSTVWLARDLTIRRNVAVKVYMSDAASVVQRETKIMKTIAKAQSTTTTQSSPVRELLGEFVEHGPNGTHTCLVLELLGPSVGSTLGEKKLASHLATRYSRDILTGLAFLHRHSIGHGDIRASNFALVIPELAQLSESDILKTLGPIHTHRVHHADADDHGTHEKGMPEFVVSPGTFSGIDAEDCPNTKLIDFSSAFLPEDAPETLINPSAIRPPEVALGVEINFRADLWSAASTISTLFTNWPLFQPLSNDNMDLMGSIIHRLGPLPIQYQNLYTSRPQWRDDVVQDPDDPSFFNLRKFLQYMYYDDEDGDTDTDTEKNEDELNKNDLKKLGDLLTSMLRYLPEDRMSAEQALRHEFFASSS